MSYLSGRTRALVEGGILSGATVMLTLLSIYIPLFWIFVKIFQAFPILILVIRQGVKPGVVASIAAGILIAMLGSPLASLYFAGIAPVAIILGWSLKEEKTLVLGLLLASIAGFFAKISIIGINLKFLGIDYLAIMESSINATTAAIIEMLKATGTDPEKVAVIIQSFEQSTLIVFVLLPVFFTVEAMIDAYLNLWLARIVLRKIGRKIEWFAAFEHWDFPRSFLYGWVLSFIAWNAGLHFFGEQALTYKFGLNVFAFFTIILFLQGFAVFSYYLKQRQMTRLMRIVIRATLLLFMMGVPIIFFGIIYAGCADMFANFRQLQRRG